MSDIKSPIACVHSPLEVTGKYYSKEQMLLKEQRLNGGGEEYIHFYLQGFKCF